MARIMATWTGFLRDENGATVIEYALIIGLMGLAVVTGVTPIGEWLASIFENVNTAVAAK